MGRFRVTEISPFGVEYVRTEESVSDFTAASHMLVEELDRGISPEFADRVSTMWWTNHRAFSYTYAYGQDKRGTTYFFEYIPD